MNTQPLSNPDSARQTADAQPATEPTPSQSAGNASAPKSVAELEAEIAAANAKLADLTAHNAELTAKNIELSARNEEADAVEILVREKMAKGLSRPQATAVVKRQQQYDRSEIGRMSAARHARRQSGNQ